MFDSTKIIGHNIYRKAKVGVFLLLLPSITTGGANNLSQ